MESQSYNNIINSLWDILGEVSDETGEEELGEGYLLKYEGWSEICFIQILPNLQIELRRKNINVKSRKSIKEIEEDFYKYAEVESYKIIEDEWKPGLEKRGYLFIEGGYDNGGLYGRTWALFKNDFSKV